MTNFYNLYYNKDIKNVISVETKEYYNRVMRKEEYCVIITTTEAVIAYHFDRETKQIVSRFVD